MRVRLLPVYICAFLVGSPGVLPTVALAGEYRYPKAAPVLSLTLPDDWTVREQDGPAQLLLCSPPDDPTYTISVLSVPTVGNDADLKSILSRITKAGATGSGMTDIAVSDLVKGPIGGGARQFSKVTASGKHDGEDSAYTFYAFTLPAIGKSYAVGVAGLQAMIDVHKAEFEAVAQSIVPIK